MTTIKKVIGTVVVVIAAFTALASFYTVKETEQALVFQFGKIIATVDDPGLHFKIPVVQSLKKLPAKTYILPWDGDRGLYTTSDKQTISRDFFAKWRIEDPVMYYKSTGGGKMRSALTALNTIFNDSTKTVVNAYPFIDNIRSTKTELSTMVNFGSGKETFVKEVTIGRDGMVEAIHHAAARKAKKFGIEIIDLQTKRTNYSNRIRPSVYKKLARERIAAAEKFKADGKAEYDRIVADGNNQAKRILSNAQKEYDTVIGKAEAEATVILAQMDKDSDFFEFQAKLDTLKKGLKSGDTVYISTKSPLFEMLKATP